MSLSNHNDSRNAKRALHKMIMATISSPGRHPVGYYMKYLTPKEKEDIKFLKSEDVQDRI